MALTISQVNQGFLALFGRPATGAEATKFASQADVATLANALLVDPLYTSELTASFPKIKTVDLNAATDDAFIESLYQALIGRASDAEGKTYWLGVKAAGATREEVLAQFEAVLKEQATQGTADGVAYENIMSEDTSLVSAWVETLYQNLAARASDVEGLNYWTTQAIQNGGAAVVAAFAASLAAQGATTEDGQNFAQKQGVADAFTNGFKDFNSLITANEKAEALKNLHTMMDGVNKDSQLDQYTEEVIKFVDEYQNIAAVQFTKSEEDQLGIDPETGESNLKSAANFTGTYNLTDPLKGTIQSSDSATGSENYLTDTLTVNITGYDKNTTAEFSLGELPSTTSVEKLYINNGAAAVTDGSNGVGSIDGDFEYINVKGTGAFKIQASTNKESFKDIVLNSAGDKDNTFTTAQSVQSLKTAAGNDTITVSTITKSLSTGAGDDSVTASLAAKATADLGAGKDSFTGSLGINSSLNAGAGDDTLTVTSAALNSTAKGNAQATIEIDGGTGNDTLDLSLAANSVKGIKSVKGVENLKVAANTELFASAVSGQKLALSSDATAKITLDATGASAVDLSKFTNEDKNVAIEITKVKSGNVSLETGDTNFKAIAETIVLANDAKGVNIRGFEKANDKIAVEGAVNVHEHVFTYGSDGKVAGFAAGIAANSVYTADLKDAMTAAKLKELTGLSGLKEGDLFYVIAYDANSEKSSSAKVYKIEVGKTGDKVAKVDQMATINVSGREVLNPSTDAETDPAVAPSVLTYNTGATELNLASGTYSGASFEGPNVVMNAITGDALTVSGANTEIKKVDAFLTDAQTVTNSSTGDTKVNVYLGGSEDGQGIIKAGSEVLDFKTATKENSAIASGADTLVANTTGLITLKDATAFTGAKLDLSKVDATIAIVSGAATTNLTALVANENANDKISVTTVADTTSVTGTNAQDTITLAAAPNGAATIDLGANDQAADTIVYGVTTTLTNFKGDTITNFGTEDKIDLKAAIATALSAQDLTNTTGNAFTGGKFYTATSDQAAGSVTVVNDGDDTGILDGTTGTAEAGKGVLVVKTTEADSTNKWEVYAIVNDNATLTQGEVALVATVDNAVALNNVITTLA